MSFNVPCAKGSARDFTGINGIKGDFSLSKRYAHKDIIYLAYFLIIVLKSPAL